MAILDIIEFNAVPTAQQTIGISGGAIVGAGTVTANKGGSTAQGFRSIDPTDNGTRWLEVQTASTGSVNGRIGFLLPMAPYAVDATKKFYVGFRFKRYNGASATASSFNNVLTVYFNSSDSVPILLNSQIPNWKNGNEYYVEAAFDYVNKLYSVWVDNVPIWVNVPMPAGFSTNLATIQPVLALGHDGANTINISEGTYFSIRDIYVKQVDNADDDFRLGPQILRRLPLATVTAQDWTPANGKTLANSFNDLPGGVTDYSDATTFAVSDPNQHSAELTFDLPANLLYPTAVIFDAIGSRPSGAAGVIRSKVTDGVTASAEVVKQLSTAVTQPLRLLQLVKNLDGSKLTPAGINQMDLIIQPSIV